MEHVHLLNSPKFHFVPTRVQNLIIDGVNIRCPHWAQNGDAMDPGNKGKLFCKGQRKRHRTGGFRRRARKNRHARQKAEPY